MERYSITIKVLKESRGLFSICINTWSTENYFLTALSETKWEEDYANLSEENYEIVGQKDQPTTLIKTSHNHEKIVCAPMTKP